MGALLSEPILAVVVDRCASTSWRASAATMQGWRRTHEDAHILKWDTAGSGVFAVLDGHGGCTAAQVGSGILERRLLQLAGRGTLSAEAATAELLRAFVESDAELRSQLDPEDRSGTTVVAAIITQTQPAEYCVQLVHSGDSRAVLCMGGELICTEDHKPDREDEVKRIQTAGGSVTHGPLGNGPMRVDGMLAVSRALGDFHFKPPGMDPGSCKVTAVPEVRTVAKCTAGDWLLLACDGVFDVMSNEEVKEFVGSRLHKAAPEPPDGGVIALELLKHCVNKGSKDNCTACIVQLQEEGGAPSPLSSELVQGPWGKAAPFIQAKYAQFFRYHGFETEADELQAAVAAGTANTNTETPPPEPPVRPTSAASGSAQTPSSSAWTKTLHAMQSIRAIQGAWRARRGNKGDDKQASGGAEGAATGASQPRSSSMSFGKKPSK